MMAGNGGDGIMVSVATIKLLEILKTNRDKHVEMYKEACIGYKLELELRVRELSERVEKLNPEGNNLPAFSFSMSPPVSHEADYKRVIGMLEMHTGNEMVIDADNYSKYVDDNWSWSRDVLLNHGYAQTARMSNSPIGAAARAAGKAAVLGKKH